MINGTAEKIRGPVSLIDRDRFFPFFISTIANKISRGGSRVYLRLFGVGIIESRILEVLAEAPGATAQAVCNQIDLDKAAASRSLQVLERLGYVEVGADPNDARKRTLILTATGLTLHQRILQVSTQREQHLLEGFSEAERGLLLSMLRRMHANAVDMDRRQYVAPPAPRSNRRQRSAAA